MLVMISCCLIGLKALNRIEILSGTKTIASKLETGASGVMNLKKYLTTLTLLDQYNPFIYSKSYFYTLK